MTLNNNNKIQIPILILLCFALGKCTAHGHDSKDSSPPPIPNVSPSPQAYPPEATQFSDSEEPFPFPPSEAPNRNPSFPYPPSEAPNKNPTSEEDDESSSSFSAAFSDILKGSLRGHSITLPEHIQSRKQKAVKNICAHTDYPEICIRTVTPFLNHKFEVMNILEASIKACRNQLKFTIAKVKKHIASSHEMASALTDCRDQYNNAMENLQIAMDAIATRDVGTITVRLSAVMADCSSCESGFEDLKSSSPMSRSEGLVTVTASNCLRIASLIPA